MVLRYCVVFVICNLWFVVCTATYALDLERLKVSFLKGDYKAAIIEGEKIMANASHSREEDELYYLLAVSYLKEGNFLRASDIFEIILKEFKASRFKEEALLGCGDAYFLKGDYQAAQEYYARLLQDNSHTKFKAQLYARLSQVGFKKGDTPQGKGYEAKLKQEFPLHMETLTAQDMCSVVDFSQEPYYSVQVGCFSSQNNAGNLVTKLKSLGYDAFINEPSGDEKKIYRVKVGKYKSRSEAALLEQKLSEQGYPTRISP